MSKHLNLGLLTFLLASSVSAAYHFTTIGSGTQVLTAPEGNSMHSGTISFSAITVNRSAAGFGDLSLNQPNVLEGMWMQYSFSVPVGKSSSFDLQNTMGGMWSGFGGPNTGEWQRGPTSSTWSRATRVQHDFYDRTGAVATTRGTDTILLPELNTGLAMPSDGDVFQVLVVLNAITNSLEYTYRNLTKNQEYLYTITNAHSAIPNTNLSFNSWAMRSDIGPITPIQYSFGTLHVVPEPKMALLCFAGLGLAGFRRNRLNRL